MRLKKALAPVLLCAALFGACAREPRVGETVKREGQPDMTYVAAEDAEMNASIEKARASLQTFKAALGSRPAGSDFFAVKVAFTYGLNSKEHIWLTEPTFASGRVSGQVGNEPVNATFLRPGQRVSAPESDVSDWMYVESGVLRGGYTLRVLLSRLPSTEREKQLQEMGFRLE